MLVDCYNVDAAESQIGAGYGRQFMGNTDLSQVDLFYRMPLSYKKKFGGDWQLSSTLEFSGAIIDDNNSETSSTGRLSLMPQVMLSPNEVVYFLFGLGAGCMMGETGFEGHDLGGPFFFSSKLGLQFILGKYFGLEYNYYHQSNAGIYDFNASLNMHQVSFSYRF